MADAEEQDVLSLWQGLGYYRRARHLKACAERICENFSGAVPSEVEQLLELPGVGKYTAGAIASIAFGHRVPIVDANVHRVLCRLVSRSGDPLPSTWTWDESEKFVQECNRPAVFNEALMEFGATVCMPKKPQCTNCPVQNNCDAYKNNTQLSVPTQKQSTKKKVVFHYAVVMEHGNELAFEQRGDNGLWAGMWQVPTLESEHKLTASQVAKKLKVKGTLMYCDSFQHTLSHRSIALTVFSCKSDRDDRYFWFQRDALAELPLASAQRKVLAVHCSS